MVILSSSLKKQELQMSYIFFVLKTNVKFD